MKLLNKKGTSLMEIMVAVAILASVLIAILGLVIITSRGKEVSSKKIVATNLARECIEVTRNIRDTNWLEIADRDYFLKDIFGSDGLSTDHSGIIVFDGTDFSIDLSPASTNFPDHDDFQLHRTTDDTLIQQVGGVAGASQTGYYRIAYLNDICENSADCVDGICEEGEGRCGKSIGLQIKCQVNWRQGGFFKKVILTDRLYDWKY